MTSQIKTVGGLAEAGLISGASVKALEPVAARYAIAITPQMQGLIDAADPIDPIALQFVPKVDELNLHPAELADPIGDHAHSPVDGLVHRYTDRVLLKAVHVCPVYCRFCFRREMVGPKGDGLMSDEKLAAAYDYIRAHPEIWEVIITGGDPLVLSPRRLAALLAPLADIPHVKIVRFHSRVPVVEPTRIDDDLVQALKISGKTTVVALHANHSRELSEAARAACAKLIGSGIMMVSQTVLLKEVNDSADTLADLMRAFVETGIKPYYLHHPDLAPGTGHFRVPIDAGQSLMAELKGKVSGLCQPTYVLDLPGGFGKIDLMSNAVTKVADGAYRIKDSRGRVHDYADCLPTHP